ncbi:MAG: hypothetical protein QNJ77_12830 [Acidimicrobiia bacterium]|nr:hypothetical protein [Acidimicrobiia bacterium]
MLRESFRILKPGGTTCFAVIAVAEGLTDEELAEAINAGPPYVTAAPGYPELMSAVRFSQVDIGDVTDGYLETLRAWHSAWRTESVALKRVVGNTDYDERQANRVRSIKAVEDGLLRRYLISGIKA